MNKPTPKPAWQRAAIAQSAVITAALIVAALYWAQAVFIPFALAVFFTYILAPMVRAVEKRGANRVVAVLLVVGLSVAVVGTVGFVVTRQLADLGDTLTDNKDAIKQKVARVRTALGLGESKLDRMLDEIATEALADRPAAGSPAHAAVAGGVVFPLERPQAPAPGPVAPNPAVEATKPSWTTRLVETVARPAGEVAGMGAFALVLMMFMLLSKEDLQDRLMRLVGGNGTLVSATRATGEATRRLSRYLLTQLLLNAGFGLVVTAGLLLLNVPAAPLWGFVGFLMRYIPFIGSWLAVLPPALLAFATVPEEWQALWLFPAPGLAQPIAVVVLIVGLELLSANVLEPRLFGHSLGVSEVALLVSTAFWLFLWGPIGMILAAPITTCLLILGKYHPQLKFLDVLLGTDPPLTPGVALFQRLSAHNQDDAVRVAEAATPPDDKDAVFDAAVVPALALVKQSRAEGELDADEERRTLAIAAEVIDDLADDMRPPVEVVPDGPAAERVRVLGCPARDEADRLTLEALAALLPAGQWDAQTVTPELLTSETVGRAAEFDPHVICIGSLPPNGLAHVRYLCKRLRAKNPKVKILVGAWGEEKSDDLTARLIDAGASAVETTLTGARAVLADWRTVFAEADAPKPRPGRKELVGTPAA